MMGMKTTAVIFSASLFISIAQAAPVVVTQVSAVNSSLSLVRIRLFKDLDQFPLIANAKLKSISKTVVVADGVNLFFQGKKLATKNFIIHKPNNKFDLIAVVDFNSYLAGVVSKEMPLSWPLEALKAQAVIARSYALTKIDERQNKTFHLDNDQMDQVFAFTNSDKAKKAVILTDGVVLKDQNNKVLKAFYHSDCGGQTVPASQVWKGAYDSGTATDPWCAARKSNEWTYEIAKDDFYKRLNVAQARLEDDDFQVNEEFKNRIQTFKVLERIFSVQKLREVFGFSSIRNSPLSVQDEGNIITFKGKGFGHGAGLCQWGTLAQTKMGRSYLQVLQHYYPKANITNSSLKLSKNSLETPLKNTL